ncbi:hypothetical protein J5751_06210 [bacterium]|nr:hypothetical protein [bacterium]
MSNKPLIFQSVTIIFPPIALALDIKPYSQLNTLPTHKIILPFQLI